MNEFNIFCNNIDLNKFENKVKDSSNNNDVIIIFANYKYKDIIVTRVLEMKKNNMLNFLIISLDQQLNIFLTENNIPFYYIPLNISEKNNRKKLWIYRSFIWYIILNSGFNILHLDADSQIIKNPLELFNGYDITFTQGTIFPLKIFTKWKFVVKCGCFYVVSNNNTILFFKDLMSFVVEYKDDQIGLNMILFTKAIQWNIDKYNIYCINFRNNSILCSQLPIVGKINNMIIQIIPHHLIPRVKHDLNTPYIIDYLEE